MPTVTFALLASFLSGTDSTRNISSLIAWLYPQACYSILHSTMPTVHQILTPSILTVQHHTRLGIPDRHSYCLCQAQGQDGVGGWGWGGRHQTGNYKTNEWRGRERESERTKHILEENVCKSYIGINFFLYIN
jgi:hypothetical protein